jgi:hypothetical protein
MVLHSPHFMGIDPGADGAIAVLSEEMVVCYNKLFHKTDGVLTPHDIHAQLTLVSMTFHGLLFAVIEDVKGRGGKGVQWSAGNNFAFGRTCGWLEMALVSLGIPYAKVTPQKWMNQLHKGIGGGKPPKERSLIAAKRLFPNETFLPTPRCKKAHDGMIDALLMAEYARRNFEKIGRA